MQLAKNYIDIGLQTNQRDAMLEFWQQGAGLPYEELLKVGGGDEGRPPATLGKVARISFVKDPDGNWIEISQRASLTGDLS